MGNHSDRFSGIPEYPEDYLRTDGPAMDRVKQRLGEYWQQFQLALQPMRHLNILEARLHNLRTEFEGGEFDQHEYTVKVLEILNFHGEPLTGALMDQYGIEDFALTFEDFDRVCLDFVNSKHKERMIVDPDSVPEDLDELPMSRMEIGDELKGVLQEGSGGLLYLRTQDDFPYLLGSEEELMNRGRQSLNKKIESRIIGSEIRDFKIVE
jgi:hypothetical protein